MKRVMASSAQMRLFVLAVLVVLAGAGAHRAWPAGLVRAANVVNFIATDDVGPWFRCVGAGCVQAGTQSLAVVNPGTDVQITVGKESGTVHTFSSLVCGTDRSTRSCVSRQTVRSSRSSTPPTVSTARRPCSSAETRKVSIST